MSKTKKLWGVSLLVLAFSFDTNAQTCKVPPTCESMGFTMTAAACNGKTILKCPFDEAKVYCPSALENNKIYKIGDMYTDERGIGIGKVVSITDGGRHGTVAASGGSSTIDVAQISCSSRTSGKLYWGLASGNVYCSYFKSGSGYSNCEVISSGGLGHCYAGGSTFTTDSCDTSKIFMFACEAPF